jgi:hypothetical protein
VYSAERGGACGVPQGGVLGPESGGEVYGGGVERREGEVGTSMLGYTRGPGIGTATAWIS